MTGGTDLDGPAPGEVRPGGTSPGDVVLEVGAAIAAYAGRLRAAGAPLAGVLVAALVGAADVAADLPDDEYDALMTSVAAWVIEGYAQPGAGAPVR